jgi:ABC-type phosphate transport system substrate-binding protein
VNRITRLAAVAALCILAGLPLGAGAREAAAQAGGGDALAILVHPANAVDGLTRGELRRIFMLETQTWPSGRKITVVLREKGQPERTEAIRLICGVSEIEFERHVLFQTFRGSVNLGLRSIQSANAMIRFIFNAPGAIGYVRADQVDGTTKVLRIDGLLPGDAKYPLRHVTRGVPGAMP